MLGGECFRTSNYTIGMPFSQAQNNMPESNTRIKIIPWDDHLKDFVYGIVGEKEFAGQMHPLELKQVNIY
jgi:hypothetical protein